MKFGAFLPAAAMAAGLLVAAQPAGAQTAGQKAIIVLDASGSMWGRVEGKTKIEVARGVIGNLLKDWDPKVALGIVAYGHREKGNCADIQTLIPVGRVNSNRIMSKVNGLNPKGKTPLSQAVRQAAQALKFTEDKATVILVSDGRETCNADPCAVAKDLEKAGVDFTVHVVGFDIKEQEKAQLQCMATNTGGKFLLAKNAAELNKAMVETVQLVAKPAPKPEPKVQPGLKLVTVLAEGGEPIKNKLAYTVYEPEADLNGRRKRITYSYDAQPLFKLPGGKYYITVKHGPAQTVIEPELKAGEQRTITVVLNAGYLRITSIPAEGAKPLTQKLANTVFESEADLNGRRKRVTYSYDAKPLLALNAGKYQLITKHGAAQTATDVEITAGKLNDLTVNLNVGYLRITSVPAEGAKPLTQKLANTVFEAEADLNGRRKQVTYSYDAKPLFRLGAGKYRLITKHGAASTASDIEITAGKLTEKTVNLKVGYLRMASVAAEGGQEVKDKLAYTVFEAEQDLEGKRKQVTYSYDAKPLFRLPEGKYRVIIKHGAAQKASEVEIKAGKLSQTTVNLNVGYLRLTAAAKQGDPPLTRGVGYVVYEAEQDLEGKRKRVTYSNDAKPLFRLGAGKYYLVVKRGASAGAAEIEVAAGKITESTVVLDRTN